MEFISNWFGLLVNRFTNFINVFKSIFSSIANFFDSIIAIVKGLWFGFITLCNGAWDLIVEVFDSGLFPNIAQALGNLTVYIGYGGAIFISTLVFVIFVRIGIGFVFKIFRLNLDYPTKKISNPDSYDGK